ncbi:MAG TPA: GNAT family N-acetyltransferase [Lentisphaeria bacterium]|nr:MAG: GNAT family N-acetyltransferase [Lentisphaerae bacterium GWF2_50_93]HCE45885.1 GNAT family N-acetyltransferase [Lentisphaeria bacterium]
MKNTGVTIRTMTRLEVDIAIAWAAAEGWNPGIHDADSFYAADPNGFFLAELNGEPAGCISAVAYDDTFGFLGFYIVRKDLRNQGIGMKLWQTAISYMGNRTVGGDGVVAMLEKYENCGFHITHRNARYEGIGTESESSSDSTLADLRELPCAELFRYDRRFFPAPRSEFLKSWINQAGSHSMAAMDGSRIAGYGVIRQCKRGFKIAPVFADTPAIAETLFTKLSSFAVGEPVFLDIPACNQAALELVERHGMTKVFETARIYKGTPPSLPLDNIYGITSFELG